MPRLAELLFVVTLCFFPLCYHIDSLSIRQWDEARNAVNAMEMLQNHNYLVRYYDGHPEVWEVKPPLLIWLQVISLRIFGLNELAIRFPTILATCFTVFLLIFYFNKYHKNRYIGYLSALILVTSQGYIDRHIARTGDHDALLILITSAAIFLYYEFLTSTLQKNHLLIILSFLFTLGVMTKSIAVMFIVPGLLVSTFLFKAQKKLFANKWFYFAILIFLILSGSYYVIRETVQPGYLKAVWQWELFQRYFNTENKFDSGDFWQYGRNFFTSRFTYWIYFLLISPAILMFRNCDKRRFYIYLLTNSLVFFLFISFGSKGLWYDGPLFPLFSAMIALFIYYSYQKLLAVFRLKKPINVSLLFILTWPLFIYPGIAIVQKVSQIEDYPWDTERFALGYYLRDNRNIEKLGSAPVAIVFDEYTGHILFYVEAINHEAGKEILSFKPLNSVRSNDLLLISQQTILKSVKDRFHFEILQEKNSVYLLRILYPLENSLITPDRK